MEILKFIVYLSLIIWILVPVRQIKTRLFLYFLILGLIDLTSFILLYLFNLKFELIYLIGTVALLYPLLQFFNNLSKFTILIILTGFALLIYYSSADNYILFQTGIHFIIFFLFLRILVIHVGLHSQILVFHLFLLVYEFSLLLKFFVFLNEFEVGLIYYYVTTAFQILIGVYFIFVNEKNSPAIRM